MNKLKNICRSHRLLIKEAEMYRDTAIYHFYRENYKASIEFLKNAVLVLNGNNEENLLICILSDLGLAYFYAEEYESAKDTFEKIELQLETTKHIAHKTLAVYYFRYGVLCSNMDNSLKAIELYESSLHYSVEPYDIGSATAGIGLAYKRNGNYTKAIEYLEKALVSFGNDDTKSKSLVYNNMANLYKLMGKYDIAEKYINMTMENIDETNMEKYFIYL